MNPNLSVQEYDRLEALIRSAWLNLNQAGDTPDSHRSLLSLQAAVAVLRSGLDFRRGLLWILRQGGDTDTNAAIAGALLGARDGFSAIPAEWTACVPFPERLDAVSQRLVEMAPGWEAVPSGGLALH